MRRLVHIAAVTAALVLAGSAGAGGGSTATLHLVGLSPVKVSGAHFRAREDVKVTLYGGGATRIRIAHTTVSGTFLVDFGPLASKDRCGSSIAVVAVGARGDRGFFKLPQLECPVAGAGAGTP